MKASRRATLHDVARRAGVSVASVSRFLNFPAQVAEGTGQRIRAAIDDLAYVPNQVAGSLVSGRSRQIAIILPFLTTSGADDTVEEMIDELARDGVVVLLGLNGMDADRNETALRAAIARQVDAVITAGTIPQSMRTMLRANGTTVIEIWDLPDDPVDVAIGFSHDAVGRALARFVRERGYVRPHLITPSGVRAEIRRHGFLDTWAETGHPPPTEDVVALPSGFAAARAVFAAMRRLPALPDVIVGGSDVLAQGIIVEAGAAGLTVPRDLAVVAIGNSEVVSAMRPTISSVDIDGRRVAREALDVLRRRAAGEPVQRISIDVGFRIIARESA
jgi:LacI family gluconate utilization system Gnt-I transcriptional repressor